MKTLLITGANNGIGLSMVKEWLKKGNCASVLDLNCENVERLQKYYPTKLLCFKCDVTDIEVVITAVNETNRQFQHIDYAIHNACLCLFKNFEEYEREDFDRVMDVNFFGALNITKAVTPFMIDQKRGKIIFTSSGVGVTGYTNLSAYACSKGAIESLARCLNFEYKDSEITFHIMHPPLTDTNSSSPLPIPKDFKASPKKVGQGFIRNINRKNFIITPSFKDALSIKFSYLFPLSMGQLLVKLTNRAMKS